ncbi:MAG: FkbM family methyltransferase [Candidatus Methylacidiphilales bacterium]
MGLLNKIKAINYKWRKWKYNTLLKNNIITYYKKNKDHIAHNELLNGLQYYVENDITVFPYQFKNEYNNLTLNIENDNGINYYLLNGHKLYFKKGWSVLSCKSYLKTLLIEQDYRSPHSYCNTDFKVNTDETLLDIGAAEGNFSLLSINTAKEVYLFEYNTEWFNVLQQTFEPFKNKVKLFNKKVAHHSSNQNSLALDDLEELYSRKLFIKMDVEGSERAIFKGMEKLLSSNKQIRLAICTYHGYNDAIEFENYFKHLGFQTEFSNGYMLYYFAKDLKPPYLIKGILRVWR